MTIFSPNCVGSVETRRSIRRPSVLSWLRPSCGFRRSEMSMPDMILSREMVASLSALGILRTSCSSPSTRYRTWTADSCGSRWMSLAPSFTALTRTAVTSRTVCGSSPSRASCRGSAGSSSAITSISASCDSAPKSSAAAPAPPSRSPVIALRMVDSEATIGTTRRLVLNSTSWMHARSTGSTIARHSVLLSAVTGMTRCFRQKSVGSRRAASCLDAAGRVQALQPVAISDGSGDGSLVGEPERRHDAAQRAALAGLHLEGARQALGVDEAHLDQDFAELPACHRLVASRGCGVIGSATGASVVPHPGNAWFRDKIPQQHRALNSGIGVLAPVNSTKCHLGAVFAPATGPGLLRRQ